MVSVRPPSWVSKTWDTGLLPPDRRRSDLGTEGPPVRVTDAREPRSRPGSVTALPLAAESEPCDDGAVARVVLLHQVGEKTAALADELEEAASRVIVLRKATEMIRERLDPLGEERDLDLR